MDTISQGYLRMPKGGFNTVKYVNTQRKKLKYWIAYTLSIPEEPWEDINMDVMLGFI